MVIGRSDAPAKRAHPPAHILAPDQLNTYDALRADDVVFSVEALNAYRGQHHDVRGGRPDGELKTLYDIIPALVTRKSYGLLDDNVHVLRARIPTRRRSRSPSRRFLAVKVASVNTANRQA